MAHYVFRLFQRTGSCGVAAALLLAGGGVIAGQSTGEGKGFTFYERFEGSNNSLGLFTRLDSTAGYNFNKYFGVEAGVPVYFLRASPATVTATGVKPLSGMGNLHMAVRLTLANPTVNYVPTLTVTAPTGDESKGLSTGHVTYDWNNHFYRTFGRLMPYGDAGIANTITDTPFFLRPFTTLGFVSHFEGGAVLRIWKYVNVGGSGYAIEPSGQQTVISRLGQVVGGGPPPGRRRHGAPPGVFETATKTTGPASIARDRGASVWLGLASSSTFDLEIGYSRSVTYALDTVFFGVGVNVASLIRKAKHS